MRPHLWVRPAFAALLALFAAEESPLRSLHLDLSTLQPAAIGSLAQLLSSPACSLRDLHIRGAPADAPQVPAAAKGAPLVLTSWENFLHGLAGNASLTELYIQGNVLTPGAAVLLGAALALRRMALKVLRMSPAQKDGLGNMGTARRHLNYSR